MYQFWADTDAEEHQLLANLQAVLDRHDTLPVVTWSGCSADLPHARKAAARLGVPDPLAGRRR